MKSFCEIFIICLYLNKCMGFSLLNSILARSLQAQLSEDGLFNFTELSKKYIRTAEEYDVTTKDGYILKLFRIPGNTSSVVLFCHGMLQTSDDFLLRGNTSLLYMTAEKDFDVWAMNFRGNRYSRKHAKLNPDKDPQFWEYSMHEMGVFDYKAIINFILKKTGQKSLSVVGHSEGTSTFFILASERPVFNKKVKLFVGLAPLTNSNHVSFTWGAVFRIAPFLNPILKTFNINEITGYYSLITQAIDFFCSQGQVGYELCFNFLGAFTGFNSESIEYRFASTIWGHFPAGTSRKNLLHMAYCHIQNRFAQYDYGSKNMAIYGSSKPPAYNIKNIVTKVALYAAKGDLAVAIQDVERLSKELPNVVRYQVIDDDKFNHIDYVWGKDAHVKVYPFVIDMLKKYI